MALGRDSTRREMFTICRSKSDVSSGWSRPWGPASSGLSQAPFPKHSPFVSLHAVLWGLELPWAEEGNQANKVYPATGYKCLFVLCDVFSTCNTSTNK